MRQVAKSLGAVALMFGAACGPTDVVDAASKGQAVEADGKAPLAQQQVEHVPADAVEPLSAAASAYQRVYPRMSADEAMAAAVQQEARKALYEGLMKDGGEATFGGAWFDPPTGVTHVAVTSAGAAALASKLGQELGLKVETKLVGRSFAELERQAEALRTGTDALSRAARGQVGLDVANNQVVVAVPAQQKEGLVRSAPRGVAVMADPNLRIEEDYGCTSRFACDYTIRAGAGLWPAGSGFVCSVGFTGRDSSNRRYTLTAGHCSNGNGVNWGTGATSIGPMYASVDTGAYDAAIIQVFNSWFAYDSGGEIYIEDGGSRSIPLNGVAPNLAYIWSGDTTCLSANYTSPNGPNHCGVIGTNSDPFARGMARVDGVDACGGDSGGGWYWLTSSGRRIGYGLHSRSDSGCHGSEGGSRSWFSPLPTVKAWAPWLNVEIRP